MGPVPFYLPVAALILAAVLFASARIPTVIRFLIGLFAVSFLLLGVVTAAHEAGLTPPAMEAFLPPPQAAIVAALLALINYIICYIPVVRRIIDMVNPFFESDDPDRLELGYFGDWNVRDRTLGLGLLGIIIILNVIQVYMLVLFNFWNNRFYTALQDKNAVSFWYELGFFTALATLWIIRGMCESYLTSILKLHWRQWLSRRYISQWLSDKVHYRLALAHDRADNPDQRISEDINSFTDQSFDIYINIFVTSLNFYAFVQILWSISAQFPYKIYGFDLSNIPGYLVWMVLVFAVVVTYLTHLVGRPLVAISFRKQKVEADFRYNLVRVRENAEQIALLQGEPVEQIGLMDRFKAVFSTTLALIIRQLKLTGVTLAYAQVNVVLPFVLLAPAYFATADMKLGAMTQAGDAFGNVQGAFSLFITMYGTLAAFKAVVNRLTSFDTAIERANEAKEKGVKLATSAGARNIEGVDVDVDLPGSIGLLHKISFALRKGERTLVTGGSGSGKTTLFRSIAGIWPYGKGRITLPQGEDVMLLPQQPYFPIGTLRATLAYPSEEKAFADDMLIEALTRAGLGHLAGRLDEHDNWSHVLSGGEKQRVAVVRAILRKPVWLLLDEATSAMDEDSEADIYRLLREALPGTTIVSIGHRSSLAALHDRRLALVKDDKGTRMEEAPLAAFGT